MDTTNMPEPRIYTRFWYHMLNLGTHDSSPKVCLKINHKMTHRKWYKKLYNLYFTLFKTRLLVSV